MCLICKKRKKRKKENVIAEAERKRVGATKRGGKE